MHIAILQWHLLHGFLRNFNCIADVMEVTFEQSFIFPNGEQVKTRNE